LKKIDAHAHYYPGRYVRELEKYGVTKTTGLALAKVKADSIEKRIEQKQMNSIDAEVLGLSSPNCIFLIGNSVVHWLNW